MTKPPRITSRRGETVMNAPRLLLTAALVAVMVAVPGHASAWPVPIYLPGDTSVSTYSPAVGGRTDQQFWGEATWSNPLSGLNLDRSSVAH
jgi:hypothetical protein